MSWRKFLFAVGLIFGALLFLRQVWEIYRVVIQEGFRLSQPAWLLAALPLGTVAYFVQMLAWSMIMRYLGVFPGLRRAVRGYFLSFLPRYIPGSVWGYWSRSEWLKQSCGIDYADSAMASILEAMALVLTALSVASGWLAVRLSGLKGLVLGAVSVGALALIWLGLPGVMSRVERWRRWRYPRKRERVSFHIWTIAVVLYLLLWGLLGSSVYLAGRAVLSVSSVNFPGAVFATSLAWLLGFVAIIVPAGIGVRELMLSTLLATYFDFLPWQGSLVAIAFRLVVILAEVEWLLVGLALYAHSLRGRGD